MNEWERYQAELMRDLQRRMEQAFINGTYGSSPTAPRYTPTISLSTALVGDDRPAPNGDAWETKMLHLLARG